MDKYVSPRHILCPDCMEPISYVLRSGLLPWCRIAVDGHVRESVYCLGLHTSHFVTCAVAGKHALVTVEQIRRTVQQRDALIEEKLAQMRKSRSEERMSKL